MAQHVSLGAFVGWKCVLFRSRKVDSLYIFPPPAPKQFKNFVLMCKENQLVFPQKINPGIPITIPKVQLQHFFFIFFFNFARDCSTKWKKNERVASPHRPIDVTFLKQFFPFFFSSYRILVSGNVASQYFFPQM